MHHYLRMYIHHFLLQLDLLVLHYAVNAGDIEMVEYLICLGANINGADFKGEIAPLDLAFKTGNTEMQILLQSKGASRKKKPESTGGGPDVYVDVSVHLKKEMDKYFERRKREEERLQKIQKEGESGRKKINQWTRYLTVIVTAFQAGAYVAYLNSPGYAEALIPAYKPFFWFSTVLTLTAGTLFVMWLGEKIQDKGLGNGISLIIMIGIISRLPFAFLSELKSKTSIFSKCDLILSFLSCFFLFFSNILLNSEGLNVLPSKIFF